MGTSITHTLTVCRVEMEEAEAITSVEILPLSTDTDGQQLTKNYLGVATNISFNEEVTSKGRVRRDICGKLASRMRRVGLFVATV